MLRNPSLIKLSIKFQSFYAWLRLSSERFAIAIVVSSSAVICLLLIFVPPMNLSTEEHGEEHGAEHGNEEHGEDHELSVEMSDETLKAAGMSLEVANAMQIKPHVTSRGQIIENANRAMNVKPRFSGVVKSVSKDFGDPVRKGETLLVVETAATRTTYAIRSVIDGIVADKRVVAGSFVPENESVLRIVDLATVWFQAKIPAREAIKLKSGFTAEVKDRSLDAHGNGSVIYVSPVVDEDTQACDIRIAIDNKNGDWRVGSFAEAQIYLDPIDVKIAVKSSAVQDLNGQSVVFKRVKDHIIATPITVGWSDGNWSEILSGMQPGEAYVSNNSFLAKAELLKSTAEHEH